MVDIDVFILSKYVKTTYRLLQSELDNWNAFGKYFLQKFDETHNTRYFICNYSNLQGLDLSGIPIFYQKCIKAWSTFRTKLPATSKNEIMNQNLFRNTNLMVNGKSQCFKSFLQSQLTKIRDIWNEEEKKFIDSELLLTKLIQKNNWIAEFTIIKSSIPQIFLQILRDNYVQDIEQYINSDLKLIIKNNKLNKETLISSEKLKEKYIQKILMPDCEPTAEVKWKDYFQNSNIDKKKWEIIWTKFQYIPISQKIKQFEWNFLHRIIFTETKLQLMNRSDGKCHFCENAETLCHLFYTCNYVQNLLSCIKHNISNHIPWKQKIIDIFSNEEKFLLGNYEDEEKDLLETIVINTKFTVWKVRNIVKYQNKNISVQSALVIFKSIILENIGNYLKCRNARKKELYKVLSNAIV